MKTYERHNREVYENPANVERFAQRFGVDAKTLNKHLQVMGEFASGQLSTASRRWLHGQAQGAGINRAQADLMIDRVLAMPSPVDRQRAYAQTHDNSAPAHLIDEAVKLAQDYGLVEASSRIEDRLGAADKHHEKQGLGFRFEDQERFLQDRQETGSVRQALEKSLVSSGVIAPAPRTLEESQRRAQGYADAVATRLEARALLDEPASLRDTVEDAWLAADALGAKADAGLGEQTISDVAERADAAASYARSMVE